MPRVKRKEFDQRSLTLRNLNLEVQGSASRSPQNHQTGTPFPMQSANNEHAPTYA